MNRRTQKYLVAVATAALLAAPATRAFAQASAGDEGTYFIKGGTIVNPGGQRLVNTNILVRDNRIAEIGATASPTDAKVIDATGKFIYPGMIDANTGIGLAEIGNAVQTMASSGASSANSTRIFARSSA